MNQQTQLGSEYIENEYDYAYEITDPRDSTISAVPYSEYYEYDEIEVEGVGGEYVLPPQDRKTVQSETQVVQKETKKAVVQDLYDENNYSLANIEGCVTRKARVGQDVCDRKETQTSSTGRERIYITKKMKITGVIILLLVIVVIVVIIIANVTGGPSPSNPEKKCIDDDMCAILPNGKEQCEDATIKVKCPKLCGTCS